VELKRTPKKMKEKRKGKSENQWEKKLSNKIIHIWRVQWIEYISWSRAMFFVKVLLSLRPSIEKKQPGRTSFVVAR
jgi:hypothetical protein